jgi:3'-phosphoadenosine 5'-phosphosulfate (PAPS) 3'-phosphatase
MHSCDGPSLRPRLGSIAADRGGFYTRRPSPENPVADRDTFARRHHAFHPRDHRRAEAVRPRADAGPRHYASGFEVEWKGVDDPVTTADREANALIVDGAPRGLPRRRHLRRGERRHRVRRGRRARGPLLVHRPLDGTKDFVQRNGEFCVMVGLAVDGRAALGVVVSPVTGVALVGVPGEGAWSIDADGRADAAQRARGRGRPPRPGRIGSRSHPHPRVTALADRSGSRPARRGSVGLKVAAVATGECDLYAALRPRPQALGRLRPGGHRARRWRPGHRLARRASSRYDTAHLGLDDGLVVAHPALHALDASRSERPAARSRRYPRQPAGGIVSP